MTIITGTSGDDTIVIDNDVITINGTVFTGPLTGIQLTQGNNTVIIKDSTISMEFLNLTGTGSDTLEITSSNFAIPEPFTGVLNAINLNNATMTVTDSFVQVPNVVGGDLANDITFTDSTLDTTESDVVRGGVHLGKGDDNVTFIRSDLTGFRNYISTGNGDDTVTLVGVTIDHVDLGRDHDTINVADSTFLNTVQITGKHGTDTLNLPAGTIVNDNVFGTFTVVAGQPYDVRSGTYTLPTGQVGHYTRMVNGEPFIVCFCQDTDITTKNGIVAVQDLSAGDMVLTMDRGFQKLKWVGSRKISMPQLLANPKLRPVRITAGALGRGLPERDLLVSRQHRMLVRSHIAQRMFGEDEILVPAIKLCELPGIFVDEEVKEVEYFHMLFDTHEVVYAEGAPSESLYTGPEALKALSIQAREEIFALFPEMAAPDYMPEAARHFPAGRKQKKLVERHKKNNREVLTH